MFCFTQHSRQLPTQAPLARTFWARGGDNHNTDACLLNLHLKIPTVNKSWAGRNLQKGFSWSVSVISLRRRYKDAGEIELKIEKNRQFAANKLNSQLKSEDEFGSLTSFKDPRPSLLIDASLLRRKKYDFEMFEEFIFIPFGAASNGHKSFAMNAKIFVGSCMGFWLLR